MTAINTQVLADAPSAREGAKYLKRLAEANRDAATAVRRGRSESEEWTGKAAGAFRGLAERTGRDTDELARITDKVARALDSFADNIGTCVSRMDDARQAAAEGGLSVRGWWIEKPPSDPVQSAPEGAGSPSLPGLDPAYHRQKEAEAKLDAWEEVGGLVSWARRLERTAHEELNSALTDANDLVKSLIKLSTLFANAVAGVGALHGAATKLKDMAVERRAFVENFKKWSADSTLSASARQAHLDNLYRSIGLTERQAASNAEVLGNLGNTRGGKLIFDPLAKTFGGSKPGVARGIGRMGSVPGAILTGVESGRQIIFEGKPVGKTLRSNFASWGVGAAVGGGAALIASTAGLASAPITITGVGVGAAASWVYSYSQNNTWADFQHDSKEAGKEGLTKHAEAQRQIYEIEQQSPGSIPLSKW